MARKRNPNKRKDYRKGGRVRKAIGRRVGIDELEKEAPTRTVAPPAPTQPQPQPSPEPDTQPRERNTLDKGDSDRSPYIPKSYIYNEDRGVYENPNAVIRDAQTNEQIGTGTGSTFVPTPVSEPRSASDIYTDITQSIASDESSEPDSKDIAKTGYAPTQTAQDVLDKSQIPEPQMVDEDIATKTIQMGEAPQAEVVTAEAPTITPTVKAGVTTAQTPEQIQAAQIEAAQVEDAARVEAAVGEVSDQALAEAAGVQRVAPIEAAQVEIVPGAVMDNVVGTLSPEAMAQAAQVAGTTLARVTRAKKQLASAGLSPEDIQGLGNDPEDLEARLMDLTEEQRGIIEGLPEEALVSNQLDSLLSGIESGEVPTWARPAVSAVEQMLARRGLSASTVGRDSLFNAIIQSAVPLAQSNAQAIQQSVAQQRGIESQAELQNAQFRQQTALSNAQNVFNLNMAQFNADQQTALSNSQFLQSVSLTNANNRQQAAIQNAVLASQANLAEADFIQQANIQNAQAFLNMDMTNLSNTQQANIINAQAQNQALLSNQAAENAARQFNATSQNQTNQFMAGLITQVNQFNVQQRNATSQFNAQQENVRAAQQAGIDADIERANAQMLNQAAQFNAQLEFQRDQWNVQNAQAIEQSNVAWRRQANTINTAAANQVAMQNAQNAFNLNSQELSWLWQEARDKATWIWQSAENEADRQTQLAMESMRVSADVAAVESSSIRENIQAQVDLITGLFQSPTSGST